MAVVYVECEGVIAKVGDKRYVMGSYSTEKKAVKAMEMLREHNEGVIFLKTIINTEKGTPFVSGLSKTDFNKLTQNYFQFPQDNEIEV
nr:MAG: hypothetical protein [Bacteriophage sp.]